MMKLPQRLPNVLMLVLWVGIGWTVMTITHELGHVAGGWLSGAHLTQLELCPGGLPFSIYHPDPYPLATLWAGPGLGCAIPLVGWLLMPHRCVAFVAAFCLIANGSYLLLGLVADGRELDTAKILAAGCPVWLVVLLASPVTLAGYIWIRSCSIAQLSPVLGLLSAGQIRSLGWTAFFWATLITIQWTLDRF